MEDYFRRGHLALWLLVIPIWMLLHPPASLFAAQVRTIAPLPKPFAIQASVAAVVATPTPTPSPTPTPVPTIIATPRPTAVIVEATPQPVSAIAAQIQARISYWSQQYGLDPSWLLRVGKCESEYNPSAVNRHYYAGGGNPTGVFQYLPDTWRGFSAEAGLAGASIWDYEAQAHVTAWAFSRGHSGDWECK